MIDHIDRQAVAATYPPHSAATFSLVRILLHRPQQAVCACDGIIAHGIAVLSLVIRDRSGKLNKWPTRRGAIFMLQVTEIVHVLYSIPVKWQQKDGSSGRCSRRPYKFSSLTRDYSGSLSSEPPEIDFSFGFLLFVTPTRCVELYPQPIHRPRPRLRLLTRPL